MDPSKAQFVKHPEHGDVRVLKEVIRDDERRWLWARRTDNNALVWFEKDEVYKAECWEL